MRECVLPDVRSVPQCEGTDKISQTCNDQPCPSLTPWSPWSDCSRTCGGGTRSKRRDCVYPRDYQPDNDCLEQLEMSETCSDNPCPEFSQWSDWTPCTKVVIIIIIFLLHYTARPQSCGGGRRRKVRECVLPRTTEGGCDGEAELEETCNAQTCPSWSQWSDYSQVGHFTISPQS